MLSFAPYCACMNDRIFPEYNDAGNIDIIIFLAIVAFAYAALLASSASVVVFFGYPTASESMLSDKAGSVVLRSYIGRVLVANVPQVITRRVNV